MKLRLVPKVPLSPHQKLIFLMRWQAKLRLNEIARRRDMTSGTVSSTLTICKKKLGVGAYDNPSDFCEALRER